MRVFLISAVGALALAACSSGAAKPSGTTISPAGSTGATGNTTKTAAGSSGPAGLPSLAQLTSLTDYTYTAQADGHTMADGEVYSPTDYELTAPVKVVVIGSEEYLTYSNGWIRQSNTEPYSNSAYVTSAKGFLGDFKIAGITVKKSHCSQAGESGTQYAIYTSNDAAALLKEVFVGCVSNTNKALLSYEEGATGSEVAHISAGQLSSETMNFQVTGIGNVPKIAVPSPIVTLP